MLCSRILPVRPNPLRLAQTLTDRPVSFLLWDATGASPSYLGCDPVDEATSLDPEPAQQASDEGDLVRAPRWVGLLPYEGARSVETSSGRPPLDGRAEPHIREPRWWRFGAVVQVSDVVRVIGDDPACVSRLARLVMREPRPRVPHIELAESPEAIAVHQERIRRALELIGQGQIYQVNLARRFRLSVSGHPVELLASLGPRSRFPYCAALRLNGLDVVSTSPELFLASTTAGSVRTAPIKGTRPRGRDAASDRLQREQLARSEKEAAELTMILDVERNDLGRVARPRSVRLLQKPRVTSYPTLHHRGAWLGARLRSGCSLEELLRVMLPSGSVTGAPKVRAMQVISELEAHRRGLYTGAFGTLSHARELTLAMAIRTLTVRESEGHYFAGGGIVADSDPVQEVRETGWKSLQVLPSRV